MRCGHVRSAEWRSWFAGRERGAEKGVPKKAAQEAIGLCCVKLSDDCVSFRNDL